MSQTKEKGHLSKSHRHAITMLTEKKKKDMRFTLNKIHFFVKCRSINNMKSLSEKPKNVLQD